METSGALSEAAEQLLQAGLLGVFVLVFGIVIYLQWREAKIERAEFINKINELQGLRVQEANAHRDQLVEVIRQCTTALTSVTTTLESQREAMMELRNAFRELAEELRGLSDEIRKPRGR